MNFFLETDRLTLQEFSPGDAAHLFELNNDPEVLKHTGDPPFTSVEAAEQFIHSYDHYQRYGMGRWSVFLKDSGEYIGWSGLKYSPELDEVDVGFRLYRRFWNKGYATESARAALNYGFSILKLDRILGRAIRENSASHRVLEKLGMHLLEQRVNAEGVWVIYQITANEFQDRELR